MALEDFTEDYVAPEVGIAVAAVAALFTPPVRKLLRRGAVLGLTGLFEMSDGIAKLFGPTDSSVPTIATAAFLQELADEARHERAAHAGATPAEG